MAKFVTINGEKFVSEDMIIDAMMKCIMMEVYVKNNFVACESMSGVFKAFDNMLEQIGEKSIREKFREAYDDMLEQIGEKSIREKFRESIS